MKNSKQQVPNHNTKFNAKNHRPENKDNLDSREGEEQDFKGDDTTHNVKPHKSRKSRENSKEKKGRQ